jgi:MoaA/NifB/PqqE/SkfB family radical SAM enzyme
MKLATWHWHIEISSKCTLKCLRCARTEVPDGLINTELSLDFFKRNFTPNFIQTNVEKITFCGDDGDPIYAHDLIEVIEYFKSIKPVKFVIVTNGSYKSIDWWARLGRTLDHYDHIHFSLDGWDQTSNEQYRVNSNWNSITQGITTLRNSSHVYMTWDAIAFSFNQDKLDDMKLLAKELGFDQFQLTLSTKFRKVYSIYPKNDLLQPKDELVSNTHRFQRAITHFNDRRESIIGNKTNLRLYNQTETFGEVTPLCSIGNKGLFINSQGHLFPCCWVANRYSHNNEWLEVSKERFNLNERTLNAVLCDSYWNEEFEIFSRTECRTKCNKVVVNQQYATEW